MGTRDATHFFILGKDYHLGDLLWFTAVLAAYRRHARPARVRIACPDRPISRILERHPLIDDLLLYGEDGHLPRAARSGDVVVVHDLRPLPIALSMLREWRYRCPWLYLRDLWLDERGQWLATFLRLGRLRDVRPVLRLDEDDRVTARSLPVPYVVLAPHTGHYALPLLGLFWRRVKGWREAGWGDVAEALRAAGYEPITLAAAGQAPIPGTRALTGLPIRRVAGVIEGAAALVSVESGLWYIAAALGRPFIIVPWWLPRSIDWTASMGVRRRLIYRDQASIRYVLSQVRDLLAQDAV